MEKQNKKTDGKTSKEMNQEECNKSWNEEFGDEEEPRCFDCGETELECQCGGN